jgi:hypothetical protein
MRGRAGRGPIVIDTDVYGADLVPGSALAAIYEPIIVGRPAFISFQTAAELRYGALRRAWGEVRMRKLEARINEAEIVHSGPGLVLTYAQLRVDCERVGHALHQRDTTLTDGSPLPLFVSTSHSSRTTGSSRGSPGSCWKRAGKLRHTCVALLIAKGAQQYEVMEHLGHTNIPTTINTYGHLFPNVRDRIRVALEDTRDEGHRSAG